MLNTKTIQETIYETEQIIKRMETAVSLAPEGLLTYRRYPNGTAVPYVISGSGKNRERKRLDPFDKVTIEALRNKTVAQRALPILRKNLHALRTTKRYQELDLYHLCCALGPEFMPSADHFLGRKNGKVSNPAFDCLRERQNTYAFGPHSVTTELGEFRSKSEAYEADKIFETGLEFKYEPAVLVGSKTIYPDFAVNRLWRMDVGYIEHLGLLENPEYREKKLDDIRGMMNHGIYPGVNLLIISESRSEGFDAALAARLIRAFCLP